MESRSVSAEQLDFYRTHIAEAVRGDGVVCLECGNLQYRVGKHILVHGLGLAAYRAKWGYPPDAWLVVPPPREATQARGPARRRRPRRTVSPQELDHYRTRIRETLQDDGVVCLECGTVYEFITTHVLKHGLTGAEYREKWGYNRGSGLVSPALHERKRRIALERNFGAMSPPGSHLKAKEAQLRTRSRFRLEARLKKSEEVRARTAAGRPLRKPRRVTDDALGALVAQGLSLREIAARTGLHPSYVGQRVRQLRLRGPGLRPPPLPVPAEALLALRRAGLTSREIAARTGLTVPAVNGRLAKLRREGVATPRPHSAEVLAQRRLPDVQLIAWVQEGLSRSEIAARVGITPSTVSTRVAALRRRGLLPADRRRPYGRKVADDALKAFVREGLTVRQIAGRTGLSKRDVPGRLRALGLLGAVAPPQRKVTDAELLALRRQGLWNGEIARQVGITAHSVAARIRRLQRRGIAVPPPAGPRPNPARRASDEQLIALARAGLRPSQIAARVGIARTNVHKRLRLLRERGLLPGGRPPAQSL